jgi:hypothetical protein
MLLFSLFSGCDPQRISELEEGVASEADVRARFGEPLAVYDDGGGAHTLEYTRQPEGHRNYMISIGADGKLSALRQVLAPAYFVRVVPGLDKAQVRRLLGQPGRTQVYALKQEESWEWRYLDGSLARLFSVSFDRDGRVLSAGSSDDPRIDH